MKAQDTYILQSGNKASIEIYVDALIAEQAEISFKAGYEQYQRDIMVKARQPEAGTIYFEAGRNVGIKEVVDELKKHFTQDSGEEEEVVVFGKYIKYRDGGIDFVRVEWADWWVSKLKEWGI